VISEAAERGVPLEVVEQEHLGATHAEVGGYLLGLWGFPDPIAEAAAYHHRPEACGTHELTPALLVHAADFLVHLSGNRSGSSSSMRPEVAVCAAAGLDLLDPEWQRACLVSAESPTP
jgi:HD-like signal output (HDOD) protein